MSSDNIYIGKLPNWVAFRAGRETLSGEQVEFTIVTSPNSTVSERIKLSVAFLCHLPSVTSGSELDLRNFGKKDKVWFMFYTYIMCLRNTNSS
jgi:hypothetical protein